MKTISYTAQGVLANGINVSGDVTVFVENILRLSTALRTVFLCSYEPVKLNRNLQTKPIINPSLEIEEVKKEEIKDQEAFVEITYQIQKNETLFQIVSQYIEGNAQIYSEVLNVARMNDILDVDNLVVGHTLKIRVPQAFANKIKGSSNNSHFNFKNL